MRRWGEGSFARGGVAAPPREDAKKNLTLTNRFLICACERGNQFLCQLFTPVGHAAGSGQTPRLTSGIARIARLGVCPRQRSRA